MPSSLPRDGACDEQRHPVMKPVSSSIPELQLRVETLWACTGSPAIVPASLGGQCTFRDRIAFGARRVPPLAKSGVDPEEPKTAQLTLELPLPATARFAALDGTETSSSHRGA
jgi:hypothetical protein